MKSNPTRFNCRSLVFASLTPKEVVLSSQHFGCGSFILSPFVIGAFVFYFSAKLRKAKSTREWARRRVKKSERERKIKTEHWFLQDKNAACVSYSKIDGFIAAVKVQCFIKISAKQKNNHVLRLSLSAQTHKQWETWSFCIVVRFVGTALLWFFVEKWRISKRQIIQQWQRLKQNTESEWGKK